MGGGGAGGYGGAGGKGIQIYNYGVTGRATSPQPGVLVLEEVPPHLMVLKV